MGKFRVEVTSKAEKDLEKHFKSGNKANIRKIERLFIELSEHPYEGTGQPEELKYELSGYWSRRINQKDRLIYSVSDSIVTVTVVSVLGHYSDK
jgi:toxin YoeB